MVYQSQSAEEASFRLASYRVEYTGVVVSARSEAEHPAKTADNTTENGHHEDAGCKQCNDRRLMRDLAATLEAIMALAGQEGQEVLSRHPASLAPDCEIAKLAKDVLRALYAVQSVQPAVFPARLDDTIQEIRSMCDKFLDCFDLARHDQQDLITKVREMLLQDAASKEARLDRIEDMLCMVMRELTEIIRGRQEAHKIMRNIHTGAGQLSPGLSSLSGNSSIIRTYERLSSISSDSKSSTASHQSSLASRHQAGFCVGSKGKERSTMGPMSPQSAAGTPGTANANGKPAVGASQSGESSSSKRRRKRKSKAARSAEAQPQSGEPISEPAASQSEGLSKVPGQQTQNQSGQEAVSSPASPRQMRASESELQPGGSYRVPTVSDVSNGVKEAETYPPIFESNQGTDDPQGRAIPKPIGEQSTGALLQIPRGDLLEIRRKVRDLSFAPFWRRASVPDVPGWSLPWSPTGPPFSPRLPLTTSMSNAPASTADVNHPKETEEVLDKRSWLKKRADEIEAGPSPPIG